MIAHRTGSGLRADMWRSQAHDRRAVTAARALDATRERVQDCPVAKPGSRKRQRNRRKGAPPPEGLMYPSVEGPIIYMIASGISSWWRKRRRRRQS